MQFARLSNCLSPAHFPSSIPRRGRSLAGFAALWLLAGCGQPPAEDAGRILPVRVTAVEGSTSYLAERRYLGEVEAGRAGPVGFEVAGTVARLEVDVGDAFAAGEPLAWLDTARLEASADEAEATLAEARIALEFARTTLERSRTARAAEAVSPQTLDERENAVRLAEARVARAEAARRRVEVDLAKSVLRAPYAGSVDARHLDEGAIASPGQPVFTLKARDDIEIRFAVPPAQAERLAVGDRLAFSLAGEVDEGTVLRIRQARDARTRGVDVFLGVSAQSALQARLRPGTLVAVEHAVAHAAAGFWLPRSALTEGTRGLWACFVASPLGETQRLTGATHRLARVDLEWLHADGERVYLRGPLSPGDAVVTTGLHRLVPDQRVRLLEATEEDPAHVGPLALR
jgi:RND family efflux transporter MFP subunit